MSKVLVVAAHPDDEILGAGGTLIKHRNNGDEIAWLIATKLDLESGFTEGKISQRNSEINEIAGKLNMKVFQLAYPTMQLSTRDLITMVPEISEIFNSYKPERIYLINRSDAHSDHRVLFDAVISCTKSFRYPFIRDVWMYECLSETEFAPALPEKAFIPTCFVDVSVEMDEKLNLMNVYESEVDEHPFPRSERNIRALASFRGASCGVNYAEAFQILKSYRFEEL